MVGFGSMAPKMPRPQKPKRMRPPSAKVAPPPMPAAPDETAPATAYHALLDPAAKEEP